MRLYVKCTSCDQKIYLNVIADTRDEWREKIGEHFLVECRHCDYKETYSVDDVYAEEGVSSAPAGAVLGGLIGLLGGPLGMILGGTFGALLGATTDENEKRGVRKFNDS
jgi:DNA-directed RNA polymerase subunit RPC12/RpoP